MAGIIKYAAVRIGKAKIEKGMDMNQKQTVVLCVIMFIIAVMLIYPPYHKVTETYIAHLGWGFIFTPHNTLDSIYSINYGLLITQWIGILIIGSIAFYVLKDNHK